MHQGGDYGISYYQHHQNHQNQSDLPSNPSPFASAPPFSHFSSDNSGFSSYPPYVPNSDQISTVPPTAPSYNQNPPFLSSPQAFNPPSHPSPFAPSSFPSFSAESPYPSPPIQQNPSVSYPPDRFSYQYEQQNPMNYSNPSPSPSPSPSLNPSPNPNPNPNSNINPNPNTFPVPCQSHYGSFGSSVPPVYDNPAPGLVNRYETTVKFDHEGYLDETSSRYGHGGYSRTRPNFEQELYNRPFRNEQSFVEKKPESGHRFDRNGFNDDGLGEDVYAYDGGRLEPYGARGTGSKSWSGFDDYGRSTSFSSSKDQVGSAKIVRAVPKVEAQEDVKNGVQKFRVKLLPEGGGHSTMDVLCQIGLDGIRMLDPNTNRTLRIYPLETVTRWEVMEPSIYTFWSKSSVDIEPRRIRLKSNSYTTSNILDTVTAATVQLKEMGGKDSIGGRSRGTSDATRTSEQTTEKKKGFTDWMNLIKPGNEEKDHWVPDEAVTKCTACGTDFGAFVRRHHCRNCGDIFCDKCTQGRIALSMDEQAQPVRVCDRCLAEVSQRLSNAKEAASKPVGQHSHEDLARKLQEELDLNRKSSSGSSKPSNGSGRRMREVACPTCTVHLQVQVPSSGSETIECGVCQHPFLVSAH